MKYRLSGIKTDIDEPMEALPRITAKKAGIRESDISFFEIRKRSIDSRKKPHIQFVYAVDFVTDKKLSSRRIKNLAEVDEEAEAAAVRPPENGTEPLESRPVVIGAGPCGLFAALELAKAGYWPLLIERGPAMSGRVEAVERFRKDRVLDPEANMLFGEGGAGTFSDGKLATGIKDGLIRKVLAEFRDAGAGDDIMYLAKPHIGTDVLRSVIVNIRKKIVELGGEVRFETRVDCIIKSDGRLQALDLYGPHPETGKLSEYRISADAVILAVGHSARDTFEMLNEEAVVMAQKPFSIGVRMEHPQSLIDASQYGEENLPRVTDALSASAQTGKLPPADYSINYKASNGRGVYSFCMCPGGEVVVCSTRDGELCVNGMSNRKRDSGTANSGILCDVRTSDFGSDDVLSGVRFQEKYERLAFRNGGSSFAPPSCTMKEFLTITSVESSFAHEDTASLSPAERVCASLPGFASEAIREAVPDFARKIKGYDDPDAVVTAVETRSSSPVRILRDAGGESNIKGLYPAGEGAGYAGGITSAACDGIRAAWHIIEKYKRPE